MQRGKIDGESDKGDIGSNLILSNAEATKTNSNDDL